MVLPQAADLPIRKAGEMELFVGDDWAEDHHDVEVQDARGRRLAKARLAEGVAGMARLHAMIGEHLGEDDAAEVRIAIETDRGPWVRALGSAGYVVLAVNPLQAARHRDLLAVSGAKSDRADAHMLADMARTSFHQLRPVAGDSDEAEAVKVVTRMHKTLIWERTRAVQRLRHALLGYFRSRARRRRRGRAATSFAVLGRCATSPAFHCALAAAAHRHRAKCAAAARPSRQGSRLPLTRGRPRLPVRGGASSHRAASLRSRVAQVTSPGRRRSALPAQAASATTWIARSGRARARAAITCRASTSREAGAGVRSSCTSRASTGSATDLARNGSQTMTAQMTPLFPKPTGCGPFAEPSWNQPIACIFRLSRRNSVSSTATVTGCPSGTSSATISFASARPRASLLQRAAEKNRWAR
jgi:hypothetical protein